MTQLDAFFATARERQTIYLRRRAGLSKPWTTDPVYLHSRFCNVFREQDKTTVWFRENVRDPLKDKPEVLLATVLFRWFNRISTGEAIFLQTHLDDSRPAWDFRDTEDFIACLHDSIKSYCGRGPYVTGSYIIQGWRGMNKMDGVLRCVQEFVDTAANYPDCGGGVALSSMPWREVADMLLADSTWGDPGARVGTLENVWSWLRQFPYMGDFMSYEVVSDLRWTALLDHASDILTWANPGPGAARGMGRVVHGDPRAYSLSAASKRDVLGHMREVLESSADPRYWPQWDEETGRWFCEDHAWVAEFDSSAPVDWPAWEMREVEHWLCEFDKYQRIQNGEGDTKMKFAGD